MMTNADVIVVGLGAMGAATLHQLARRGARAIGIDRYQPPHNYGSSHGETRITRLGVGEGEQYVPLARRSHEIWRELEAETGEALLLECGFVAVDATGGVGEMHGKAGFMARTIAAARAHDIPHELISADELRRRHPAFSPAGHEVVYFEPGGGLVFPERCIAAQLRRAAALGATIITDTEVLGIDRQGSGATVRTVKATYSAARVVVTAGGWTGQLVRKPMRQMRLLRQVLHWFSPEQPDIYVPGRCPTFIWLHGTGPEDSFYGFPLAPGVTPGVKIATEQFSREIGSPEAMDRAVAADESTAMLGDHADGRLVGLNRRAIRATACFYTNAPDGDFVIDSADGDDAVLLVSACSGHGFKHSAGVGDHVAAHLAEGMSLDSRFAATRLTAA